MARLLLYFVICVMTLLLPQQQSHSQPYSEGQLSGVYIFKMAKFIFWENESPMLCTTEGSVEDLNATLSQLAETGANGIKFRIAKRVKLTELGNCSLVFIADADETNLINILLQLRDKPIVTVSTIPGFVTRGGMFGLLFDSSGRISAQVKYSKVQERGIKVNANLLKVMKVVE